MVGLGRVRGAVGVGCTVDGPLVVRGYVAGEGKAAAAHNVLDVSVIDEYDERIEGLDGEDVCVDVGIVGGGVSVSVAVCVDGRVRVEICVPEGVTGEVVVSVWV